MGQTLSTKVNYIENSKNTTGIRLFTVDDERKELSFLPIDIFVENSQIEGYEALVLVEPRKPISINEIEMEEFNTIRPQPNSFPCKLGINSDHWELHSTIKRKTSRNTTTKYSLKQLVNRIKENYFQDVFYVNNTNIWVFTSIRRQQNQANIVEIIKRTKLDNYVPIESILPSQIFNDEIPECFAKVLKNEVRVSPSMKKKTIRLPNSFTKKECVKSTSTFFKDSCDNVCDGLYISGEEISSNLAVLKANKITHIVNLSGSVQYFPGQFKYFNVSLHDSVFEEIKEDFWQATEFTKEAITNGGRVLVHCRKGICRSASLCIAFLMREGQTYERAYEIIKNAHPATSINPSFESQIKSFLVANKTC